MTPRSPPGQRPADAARIKALEARVETLQAELAGARGELGGVREALGEARARADAADARSAELSSDLAARKARADRAIEAFASLADRLDALAAEHTPRPWWRRLMGVGAAVMPAFLSRATPVSERDALLRVLGASVEVLKAENEMLRRRLAAAETRAAQEVARADGAVAESRRSCGSGRGRPPLATAARGISAATRWRPSGSGRGGGGWRAEPRETNPLTKYFIRYIHCSVEKARSPSSLETAHKRQCAGAGVAPKAR